MSDNVVYTVGHSNHSIEAFVELLRSNGIEALVDVRTHPYSRFATQFNRESLKGSLSAAGVRYLYLGGELGGRPTGSEFYDAEGYVLYDRLAASPAFLSGLRRLESGIAEYRVALMCSEEDPNVCHRRLLISRALGGRGIEARHIRGDGSVETEPELRAVNDAEQSAQLSLFGLAEEPSWKSIRSVLHNEKPSPSSKR